MLESDSSSYLGRCEMGTTLPVRVGGRLIPNLDVLPHPESSSLPSLFNSEQQQQRSNDAQHAYVFEPSRREDDHNAPPPPPSYSYLYSCRKEHSRAEEVTGGEAPMTIRIGGVRVGGGGGGVTVANSIATPLATNYVRVSGGNSRQGSEEIFGVTNGKVPLVSSASTMEEQEVGVGLARPSTSVRVGGIRVALPALASAPSVSIAVGGKTLEVLSIPTTKEVGTLQPPTGGPPTSNLGIISNTATLKTGAISNDCTKTSLPVSSRPADVHHSRKREEDKEVRGRGGEDLGAGREMGPPSGAASAAGQIDILDEHDDEGSVRVTEDAIVQREEQQQVQGVEKELDDADTPFPLSGVIDVVANDDSLTTQRQQRHGCPCPQTKTTKTRIVTRLVKKRKEKMPEDMGVVNPRGEFSCTPLEKENARREALSSTSLGNYSSLFLLSSCSRAGVVGGDSVGVQSVTSDALATDGRAEMVSSSAFLALLQSHGSMDLNIDEHSMPSVSYTEE